MSKIIEEFIKYSNKIDTTKNRKQYYNNAEFSKILNKKEILDTIEQVKIINKTSNFIYVFEDLITPYFLALIDRQSFPIQELFVLMGKNLNSFKELKHKSKIERRKLSVYLQIMIKRNLIYKKNNLFYLEENLQKWYVFRYEQSNYLKTLKG